MSDFDEVTDFVVVGNGGGSLCAGLLLRSVDKNVVILEKTALLGGTTSRSGGVMWIPNNPFMKRDGIEDSYEAAAAYLDALSTGDADAPGATRERRLRYLAEAPRMVDFLVSQGIKLTRARVYPDYYDDLPGGSAAGRTVIALPFNVKELGEWAPKLNPSVIQAPVPPFLERLKIPAPATIEELMQMSALKRSWRVKLLALRLVLRGIVARATGRQWVAGGAALQGRMLQAALRAGVVIRTHSPVSELIVQDGAVAGVVSTSEGRPWRVGARLGVLINAGGFARNQRMRDRYAPGTSTAWSMAAAGDTGEMIEEMMRHGAAVAQMEERVGVQMTLPPGAEMTEIKPGIQAMTAAPHAILVDQTGVRYMNEGGSYMLYCKTMLQRHRIAPAVPSWAICDSQYLRKYLLPGTLPWKPAPAGWLESGYLRKADTIAELAYQLGMDAPALEKTIERFNGFVSNNSDDDFQRGKRAYDRWLGDPYNEPSETLGALSEPPFYALPVVPGDVGTFGGVVTDTQARVLREDGSPIRGLYATGVSTASVMGSSYPGAGSSVGPSFVWGYVAAKSAAGIE